MLTECLLSEEHIPWDIHNSIQLQYCLFDPSVVVDVSEYDSQIDHIPPAALPR